MFTKENKQLIDNLVAIIKENVKKEKALGEIFNKQTHFFEENSLAIQSSIYEFLHVDEEDVGDFQEGLFQMVIVEFLTIWELLDYLKEHAALYEKYNKKEIDLDDFYDKEIMLKSKYKIY